MTFFGCFNVTVFQKSAKMSLQQYVPDTRLPFVHRRAGHVAVTWKEFTIVWGGCEYAESSSGNEYWDPAEVILHFEVCTDVHANSDSLTTRETKRVAATI